MNLSLGDFQGAESDVIIYLGPGGIEGLTRAKRKLFIVTYHRVYGIYHDENGPYDLAREVLRSAVKNKLLVKHDISHETEMDVPPHIAEYLSPG